MLSYSIRIAQHFQKLQLNHEDIVGVVSMLASYSTPVILACFFNATPVQTVHPTLNADSIRHLFGITRPKVIFCDGTLYDKVFQTTQSWSPSIFTLDDHVEGVPQVESLLEPTESEVLYQ